MTRKRLITKRGLEKIKNELKDRTALMREKIADRLDEAKAIGDLSENSAYTAALEEYHQNETKITELQKLIKTLEIAPDKKGDACIDIGDTIEIEDIENNEKIKCEIVGAGEGDPVKGRISSDSVVGSALIGRSVGDKVEIKLPLGVKQYKILAIS